MKIRVLSDLHLELSSWEPPKIDADVTVLAGDIHSHTHALDWIEEYIDGPVIYIAGNHEFYDAELHGICAELKRKASDRVHVLENESIEIDGVRFIGATLWTDYRLFGDGLQAEAMRLAKHTIPDHERIRCAPESRFTPAKALALHRKSVTWLSAELMRPLGGKTVVVTHHLPSLQSVSNKYRHLLLSAAFASHLDHLVQKSDLWIHGHSHTTADYQIGKCGVVSNPRGYVRDAGRQVENEQFNPTLVIRC